MFQGNITQTYWKNAVFEADYTNFTSDTAMTADSS